MELDVIKHTAQFVSKNGANFMKELLAREKNNPLFDFLQPTNHDMFNFFTELVESYTKILRIKQKDIDKLVQNVEDRTNILNRCGERFEYENIQRQAQKRREEFEEAEKA